MRVTKAWKRWPRALVIRWVIEQLHEAAHMDMIGIGSPGWRRRRQEYLFEWAMLNNGITRAEIIAALGG